MWSRRTTRVWWRSSRPRKDGYSVRELDRKPSTFVHEIEIGDLDGDGNAEIYATPSDPNLFDGKPQSGVVVRYDPVKGSRTVVADLGDRHAKEILVTDLDGDGKDELYVSVEAVAGGQLEIRRYQAETPADEGQIVARLQDRLCRFLTAGDVDGDGKQELVAAANRSGLWLIRPRQGRGMWSKKLIDRDSTGFEHAALLVDLDHDGKHELYVASDDQGQVRRYRWSGEAFTKEVLQERAIPDAVFTWNLMPVRSTSFASSGVRLAPMPTSTSHRKPAKTDVSRPGKKGDYAFKKGFYQDQAVARTTTSIAGVRASGPNATRASGARSSPRWS